MVLGTPSVCILTDVGTITPVIRWWAPNGDASWGECRQRSILCPEIAWEGPWLEWKGSVELEARGKQEPVSGVPRLISTMQAFAGRSASDRQVSGS